MRVAARTSRRPEAARRTSRRLDVALVAGVMLAALGASALDPSSASALPLVGGPSLNPLDGLKDIGGDILQSALEWLLGGIQTVITLALLEFLVTIELPIGDSLQEATGPIIVIGGFFLVVGLITSVGAGYREIIAGTDTAPRVIGSAIFRVIGLALLLGAWFWIVPLAIDVANGMSGYVLSDDGVAQAVRRAAATQTALSFQFPLLALLTAVFLSIAMLVLVVLKFVMTIAFACLYVGGPALIGFAALPGVGRIPLGLVTRGAVTLTVIPLAWAVVFVAWAGVSAGTVDSIGGDGAGIVNALMGPGLFFAGLVVMLAVTKKVLAMATFGLALSVPGAGIARHAVSMAAVRGLLGGGGGAGADATADAAQAPTKGGGGDASVGGDGAGQAQTAPAGQGQTGPPKYRRLEEARGSESPGALHTERQRQRAQNEGAERDERDRDATALAAGMVRGAWRSREPRPEAYQALAGEVDEQHGAWRRAPEAPADRLISAARDLPPGDQSGFAGAAKAAIDHHHDDPRRAAAEFRHASINQYAGRAMDEPQRKAVAIVAAAEPQKVWEAFGAERERFTWRESGHSAPPSQGSGSEGYDPTLFAFARGEGAPRGG
jgi:hypothetical protein